MIAQMKPPNEGHPFLSHGIWEGTIPGLLSKSWIVSWRDSVGKIGDLDVEIVQQGAGLCGLVQSEEEVGNMGYLWQVLVWDRDS